MKVRLIFKGGPGSGHHGHTGRPGHQGGSTSSGGGSGGGDADIPKVDTKTAAKSVRSSLNKLRRDTNSWAARDTIKRLSAHTIGHDYAQIDARTARKLVNEMLELGDYSLKRHFYDDEKVAGMLGL